MNGIMCALVVVLWGGSAFACIRYVVNRMDMRRPTWKDRAKTWSAGLLGAWIILGGLFALVETSARSAQEKANEAEITRRDSNL